MNKIIHGNCLDVLPTIPDASVDAVICDPPYEIGFMSKSWDNSGIAYNVEMWSQCLRVLKPGGYLLAFSSARTYHRMAVAIEDAGFEIRDMVEWVYACLSEDTEIFTENGWELYNKNIYKKHILCYDVNSNKFVFRRPTNIFFYENKHTAYRIQSDNTDQIVTRNHRVLVEREGKLIFKRAETLQHEENIPFLESMSCLQETISNFHKRTGDKKQKCRGQQNRKFNVIQNKCRPQEIRSGATYKTTLASITPIEYKGNVWCVEVPTGAFLARRNGKIFITGNSGFPKSLNLGKAYDERMGNKREVVGYYNPYLDGGKRKTISYGQFTEMQGNERIKNEMVDGLLPLEKGTSAYEGLGSALKPSHEPICMARKPLSEPTILDNVIKHSVGGLSIDDCRIPTEGSPFGRFPANVIVTDDALNDGTETKSKQSFVSNKGSIWNSGNDDIRQAGVNDSDSKSRYFDVDVWAEKNGIIQEPKASKSERNRGCESMQFTQNTDGCIRSNSESARMYQANSAMRKNHHPTVKPISVMSWLVRLITRPGMTILDPFTGSGSTPVACILNNRKYIGIEMTAEYIPIIEARIKQAELDVETMFSSVQSVEVSRLYNEIKSGLNPFRNDRDQGELF